MNMKGDEMIKRKRSTKQETKYKIWEKEADDRCELNS